MPCFVPCCFFKAISSSGSFRWPDFLRLFTLFKFPRISYNSVTWFPSPLFCLPSSSRVFPQGSSFSFSRSHDFPWIPCSRSVSSHCIFHFIIARLVFASLPRLVLLFRFLLHLPLQDCMISLGSSPSWSFLALYFPFYHSPPRVCVCVYYPASSRAPLSSGASSRSWLSLVPRPLLLFTLFVLHCVPRELPVPSSGWYRW